MASGMPRTPSVPRVILRRLIDVAVTLLVIIYLTFFGLIMAERGREHVPAPLISVAREALSRTGTYLAAHPQSYVWHRVEEPALPLVLSTFARSAGLLLAALAFATLLGVPLGLAMARSRGRASSTGMLLLSVLAISTPTFFLAMLLWIANIQVHRQFNIPALPPTGFGWDAHLILPMLVLAARPLAQIAQVTYVTLSDVLGQDFMRTANAKGLSARLTLIRHAIPNIRNPVLTTLSTSLRYALASLVVVEFFFLWSGAGLTLLQAIGQGIAPLVVDLVVCLGLFFLILNLILDLIAPLLDPRLKDTPVVTEEPQGQPWREGLGGLASSLSALWQCFWSLRAGRRSGRPTLPPLPEGITRLVGVQDVGPVPLRASQRVTRSILRNPLLIVSTLLIAGFLFLVIFGNRLAGTNPYRIHGVTIVNGVIGAPPFRPSSVFPWGTDQVGRDVRAMVLSGAKLTLSLALFATLARIALGATLGLLAGWWQGGKLDRSLQGSIGIWAAFPVTLFAMILIQGIGIQQGMWVFIVAFCVVGWAEIAQFVRRQTIGVKPQLYIEAARSVGVSPTRIITQHVTPQLLSALIVLGILEMGAVLMLLAELGFLNIFLGGGYKVMIAETGRAQPLISYFSDVPEWGAMLANIRDWWRSYPWMAWYPGVAFFLAILALNLWGEGLRRFLGDSRINVSRALNRYTLLATITIVIGLVWMLRSSTPLGVYQSQARKFDGQQALVDVRSLASTEYGGRETGTPGAEAAARYIAGRMEEIGLFPAGEKNTFIQAMVSPRIHVVGMPSLTVLNAAGQPSESFAYRQDFVESVGFRKQVGEGVLVGLATGADPEAVTGIDPYQLGRLDLSDKILLLPEAGEKRINVGRAAGALIVSDDGARYQRKYLFPNESLRPLPTGPVLYITSQTADRLLASTGSSLAELRRIQGQLEPGKLALTHEGARLRLDLRTRASEDMEEKYYHVIGFIPGSGSSMEGQGGAGALDSQVIIVSAYYDGLGTGPDGTLYPGANDNSSGVAAMLELARVLKESPYAPKKTVVFVAWAGGEREEGLSVKNVMSAKLGFNELTVESVLELSGVGAGDGKEIALGEGSSYRLVRLFQTAASRLRIPTTTRGRGPHYGRPIPGGFEGRSAMTLYLSWDGSDRTAHTPQDTSDVVDPKKLEQLGKATALTLSVLSREVQY
jgi:ABC-type dipeptide/oligopeptide/nickel transport system permease subunit